MAFDVSDEWITAAERALGVTLPHSLRSALAENNGGAVFLDEDDDGWDMYTVPDRTDQRRLARSSRNSIVLQNDTVRTMTRFPTHGLAIAGDGTGDALVLLHHDSVCDPAVYCWDHSTGEMEQVAADFSDLDHGE